MRISSYACYFFTFSLFAFNSGAMGNKSYSDDYWCHRYTV